MQIKMTLKSDAMPGNGEGLAGILDADIAYDDAGLPFIPAKRLKGLLRESAQELETRGAIDPGTVPALFGTGYAAAGAQFKLSNGYLEGYVHTRQSLRYLRTNVTYAQLFHPQAVIDCFTRTRCQTAMTPEGIYMDRSLRSMRVLNKGQKFFFNLEAPAEYRGALETICRVTRSLGMNRTRGLGEVELSLVDGPPPAAVAGPAPGAGLGDDDLCRIDLTLKSEGQLLVSNRVGASQESEKYIPGGFILGALAGRYIATHQLSAPHTDDTFRAIFLEDLMQFSPAYPLQDGRSTMPCPLSIVHEKNSDALFNLIWDKDREKLADNDTLQTKGCPAEHVRLEDDKLMRASVDFEVEYHHRRPADKAKGRAGETTSAAEDEGAFFQFEVLSPGQTFHASVSGPFGLVKPLLPLFSENMPLYLGKSRTAQYGRCQVTMDGPFPVEEPEGEIEPDGQAVITLASDALVLNENGFPSADPHDLVAEICRRHGIKLEIEKTWGVCAKAVKVGGFMGVWRLPRPQEAAMKAGTVILLKNTGDAPVGFSVLEGISYGQRIPEGFGRILVGRHGKAKVRDATSQAEAQPSEVLTDTYRIIKEKIGRRALEDSLTLEAVKKATKTGADVPSSFLARMLALVGRNATFDGLQRELNEFADKRAGKHAEKIADMLFVKKGENREDNTVFTMKTEEFGQMVSDILMELKLNQLLPEDRGKRAADGEGGESYTFYQAYARACLTHLKLKQRS